MAERRMFAKTIVLSDAFLDMPPTARCLYFTLGMFADDDGFVNAPRAIMRQSGASDDDMKILIAKKFVLIFDSGVIVIKHWRINNYLQKDRIQPTKYIDEKSQLETDAKGSYKKKTECNSNGDVYTGMYTENSVISNNSISSNKDKYISPKITSDEVDVVPQNEVWFTQFWEKYPKKVDKVTARKTFDKKCKSEADLQIILSGLDRWIAYWKNPQYIPYPSKWLNSEMFNDNPTSAEDENPLGFLPF